MRPPGGNEAAHLREDRDQRVLPQKGGFAGHVGAGEEPDATGIGLRWWREIAIVGDEWRPVSQQRLLHHDMTAPFNNESMAVIDLRPHVVALGSKVRKRACDIERG